MKIESKTITKIFPREGYVLTQSREVEDSERFFAEMIVLGTGDDAANYKEIEKTEADSIRTRIEAEDERRRITEERERERQRLIERLAELDSQKEKEAACVK